MKKLLILLLVVVVSITSCRVEQKEISCEQIIKAYEDAGYVLCYHNHDDPIYYELNESCHMEIEDPNDPEHNYIYITRYFTEQDAKAAHKEKQYNPILWLFFGVFGEWRWLKSGYYGDITYETFDSKMLKPLKSLIE